MVLAVVTRARDYGSISRKAGLLLAILADLWAIQLLQTLVERRLEDILRQSQILLRLVALRGVDLPRPGLVLSA